LHSFQDLLIETAYTEHRGSLVRRLTGITRDAEVAQDLAQEAFLRLAREVEAGRSPDNVAAWLQRVGANLATSRARHAQVAARHEASLAKPSEPESPEALVVEGELAAAVRAYMDQLTASERRALVLAANGFGGIEIASTIGRTPGATRTLLCRARAKIRERMLIAGFGTA
jgi:RNA polymerase sigma-70 factor (ECF subfamily)